MNRLLSLVAMMAAVVNAWPAKAALAAEGTNYSTRKYTQMESP